MKVAAVIFDLDGTVLDDEKVYGLAFKKVLTSLGASVKSDYPHVSGIGVKENWPILLAKYKVKTNKSYEQLAKETQDTYLANLSKVEVRDGFDDLIKGLRDAEIKTALATSNIWMVVEDILQEFNLEKDFDCITTGEEVERRKPDPDIFLHTADKLGVERDDCLVVEDAPSGVEAAIRAGMNVVGVYRSEKYKKKLEGADLLISDFTELTPEIIYNL